MAPSSSWSGRQIFILETGVRVSVALPWFDKLKQEKYIVCVLAENVTNFISSFENSCLFKSFLVLKAVYVVKSKNAVK